MNKVEHLIISSTLDFSTDYICYELEKRKQSYLRLNRDQFSNYKITFDVSSSDLQIKADAVKYIITQESLKSVFFRSPVFIRSNKIYSIEKQLYRSQWSSFIRNLTVFDKANWLNHPMYTYQAENKIYQLKVAKRTGLTIPDTIITNSSQELVDDQLYIVKALDTPLFYENGQEMFTYSTEASGKDIKESSIREAPVIIQECIKDKIDLRVTVVGDCTFPAKITKKGFGIEGDWRKTKKEELQYAPCVLPPDIESKILNVMKELRLSFAGIDLALSNGKYYFIEVNPTGEWGWLVGTTGYDIHKAITDWLMK